MPRANDAGGSNALGTPEKAEQQESMAAAQAPREEESSAGTSSSTSESRLDRSGSSTGTDPQSPAKSAENPSDKDQPQRQASSSVSSTDGSGQETGSGQVSQQGSSEGSQAQMPATAGQPSDSTEYQVAQHLIEQAHEAYEAGKYDEAEALLDEAEQADATRLPEVTRYRTAVAQARQASSSQADPSATQGPSEETPSAGGFATGGHVE